MATGGGGPLPWLILTDAEHTVKVEGFALSDLKAKLAQ